MAEHRNQGNRYFSEKKYEMAATCYGRAIVSVAKLVYSLIRYLCVYTYSTHVVMYNSSIDSIRSIIYDSS